MPQTPAPRTLLRPWPKVPRAVGESGAPPPSSTFGAGSKRLRRHIEQPVHDKTILQHHRQAAEIGRSRPGDHALDDFLLQHEVHVEHVTRQSRPDEKAAASRCCRAGCRQRASPAAGIPAERRKIESQRVAFVDGEPLRRITLLQANDDVTVDLDYMQMIEPASAADRSARRAPGRSRRHNRARWGATALTMSAITC